MTPWRPSVEPAGTDRQFLTSLPARSSPPVPRALGGLTTSLALHVLALLAIAAAVARSPEPIVSETHIVRSRLIYTPGSGTPGGSPPGEVRRAQLANVRELARPAAQRAQFVTTEPVVIPQPLSLLPNQPVEAGL